MTTLESPLTYGAGSWATLLARAARGVFPPIFHPKGSSLYQVDAEELRRWVERSTVRPRPQSSGEALRLPREVRERRSG